MIRTGLFATVIGWMAISMAQGTDTPRDLAAKDIFRQGFPQYLAFRGEMIGPAHKDYATWSAYFGLASGVIRKFVREELPTIHPESLPWADRFAVENPRKLMLLHLNGEARQVLDFPDVHARYFPGHWVHEPGALLTAAAGPSDTLLHVDNAKPFKINAYLNRERSGSKSWFPQHVVLVRLDEQGNRLWHESEYAIVKSVDYRGNTITVQRGSIFSTARPHQANRTYVAPIAADVWGGKPMWYYNLSSACPKDSTGRNAADVFVAEIAEWFAANGKLRHFNGIAFDVNYFEARHAQWDVDNDGHSDGGYINGRNIWQEGDWYFLNRLRKILGDNFLLSCDGEFAENQRAVGVLDGIESEGLVQHNDGFRGFSRTVNTHLYWMENGSRSHDFRYVVLKLMNPADEKRGDQLRRFASGTACCLGAMVAVGHGEAPPKPFAAPGSFGVPVGAMLRPARLSPDILSKAAAGRSSLSRLKANGCTLEQKGGVLEISSQPDTPGASLKATLAEVAAPPGDLTIFLEIESVEPLEGFSQDDRVPRLVRGSLSKTPDYGEGRYNEFYTNLYGYIGTHGRSTLAFYFRRPRTPAQTVDFSIEIQGRGRARLYSLTAHNSPDILVRQFEHGVVVVNPALEPADVALAGLCPNSRAVPAALSVPALDALFLPVTGRAGRPTADSWPRP